MTTRSIVAADEDAGNRLDRVLAAHVAELSRSRLKALIEAGASVRSSALVGSHATRYTVPPNAVAKS